jgi:hypothetical protein
MGIGTRVFFVEDDNRLKHISLKRWEDLVRRDEQAKPFPEYAGQKIRCALVVLQVENRKPVDIIGLECDCLHFDDEGRIDEEQKQKDAKRAVDMLAAMIMPEPKEAGVIDARRIFLGKQSAAKRWELTREIGLAIKEAIFIEKIPTRKLPIPPLRLI